jgi:hypothetical protein
MTESPEDLRPKLPLTVPLGLWESIARETYPAFADSYLSGADLVGSKLRTKYLIAFDRIAANAAAMRALAELGIALAKPNGEIHISHRRENLSPVQREQLRRDTAETIAKLSATSEAMRKRFGQLPAVHARTDERGISVELRRMQNT